MKTFKIVAFHLITKEGKPLEIPIADSLIINQENEKNTWLIELFAKKEHAAPFQSFGEDETIYVEVIITNRENPPAGFAAKIKSVKILDSYVSILLQGKLHRRQTGYAEELLESLMNSGYEGGDLLTAFRDNINKKKDIILPKKK